jgi:2-C-methyl-D-erythritol 4-phosphate cytidylyltransferase
MITAILVAAGSSSRMGFDKLTADLAGKPVFRHTLDAFQSADKIDAIVLVASPALLASAQALVGSPELGKLTAVVAGGAERQDSVRAGIAAAPVGTTHVAVHDAARPLVSPVAIDETVAAALAHGAAVLARPIPDTVKRVDENGWITTAVDRTGLWAMETPQAARIDWLDAALTAITNAGGHVTDEVSALQEAGHQVHAVRSHAPNLKITWPEDIDTALRWL